MAHKDNTKQQETAVREALSRELVAAHDALSRELTAVPTQLPQIDGDLGHIPSFEHLSAVCLEPWPNQTNSEPFIPDSFSPDTLTAPMPTSVSIVSFPADDVMALRYPDDGLVGLHSTVMEIPVPVVVEKKPDTTQEAVDKTQDDVVQGLSLSAFLDKTRPMPSVDWSLELFQQTCQSLQTFHQKSTFHWQLETQKIQLIELPKLTDIQDLKADKKEEAEEKKTTPSQELPYLAPEILRGEPANPRSDVYSVAAIFYEMVTDLPPHPGCLFPPNDGRFKEYEWQGLQQVLQKAMSQDPEGRYESVDELWDAIEEARRDPEQPPPSKIAQYAGKMQKEMGGHIRKFVDSEAKAKVAGWLNGGSGGMGGAIGMGSPLVDEVVKALVKEIFGSFMKAGTERVTGAIDKKIAAAQTKKASWFSRLFQGMKKSMLFMGLMIGMLTAGGVKFIAMVKQPVASSPSHTVGSTAPKAPKAPLTLRMWRSVRGLFVSTKSAPQQTNRIIPKTSVSSPKRQ